MNLEKDQLLGKIHAHQFAENNGHVLRTLTLLPHDYVRLKDIRYAMAGIDEQPFFASINFLVEEKYIRLCTMSGDVVTEFTGSNYEKLKARLTGKGIRLMEGSMSDQMVDT